MAGGCNNSVAVNGRFDCENMISCRHLCWTESYSINQAVIPLKLIHHPDSVEVSAQQFFLFTWITLPTAL